MQTLDGLDAAFLALETDAVHLQIGAVMVLEPPEGRRSLFSPSTRFDQLRSLVQRRLHLAPPLRRRVMPAPLALHRPVWVDDPQFDLDDHVHRARLPAPGLDAQLAELVADVMSQPLPLDRPLWEMVVVEGLEGERTAVVFKVHHALLDGVSGAELLGAFLDPGPRPSPVARPPSPWRPGPLPGSSDLLRHAVGGLASQPAAVLGAAQRMVEAGLDLSARNQRLAERGEAPPPRPFGAPRTSLNGTVGARRRYATALVSLADARMVGRAYGTTVNDVVLACVTGALRELLVARHEAPPETLVAMVPISVRVETEHGTLGNKVSGTLVALPTGVDDPVERLRSVSGAARAAKAQAEVLGDRVLMQLAEAVPSAVLSAAAREMSAWRVYDRMPPPANVTVSNVVGPAAALWCAGSRVEALYPAGPVADGVGLNVTVLSYLGTLHCGLLACRRLVPELDRVAGGLTTAASDLVAAAARRQGAVG